MTVLADTEKKYRIGEFSAMVGLPSATLRYYESEGLLVPHRDHRDQRYYTEADRDWLKFILHLKGIGMTITELKDYIALRAQGDETIGQRLALLKRVQKNAEKQIMELSNNLSVLNHKINWYEGKQNHQIADDETFAEYLKRIKENN